MKRYALVANARTRQEVEAYLPSNYTVLQEVVVPDVVTVFVIVGEDKAGWTFEGYVQPRLASGLIYATEIDLSHPVMKQVEIS